MTGNGGGMALIICSDCGNQVSDRASACPQCGAPTGSAAAAVQATGTPLLTTQRTAKRLKLQTVLSVLLTLLGFTVLFTVLAVTPEETPVTGWLLTLIGAVWFLITRLRIWWHHD